MRAVVITRPGGPEVLQVSERPTPVPANGEVLIKVNAAGVNRPDVYQRKGNYPPPPGASPDIPGLEVAGVIERLGPGDSEWKVGDRVCALLTGGGYASHCTVPGSQCLPIPSRLNFVQAASLPETYFTVWSNVFEIGRLLAGESLLVHGGSSGIGVAAIQLASRRGATVFVTSGTDEKAALCRKLGAHHTINYNRENFREAISGITENKGVDVILDMIGGEYTNDNVASLAIGGRLVMINFMKGENAQLKLGPIMQKRLVLTGSTLRPRDVAFKAHLASQLRQHVWPLFESGDLQPVIYKTFPLDQAAAAQALMESGNHYGKIVLEVARPGD